MSATETKALVERLRELDKKATGGTWSERIIDVDASDVDSDDKLKPVAYSLDCYDAALVVELRNALPQILAALEPLTREPDDGTVEVSAVELALLRIMPEFGPADEFGHYSLDHGNIALLVSRAIAALPRRDAMRELEAERDRLRAELEKMREESANLLFSAASTFKARNGRDVGIEADDGEKCWIVHDDLLQPFRNFVERAAIAALPRREAMREALIPFAREVGRFGRGNDKRAVKLTMEDRDGHPAVDLLVSDFEAARAALTEEPGHGG